MEIKKISKIQFRQDSEANFRAANPVLDQGEPAYCTDTDTLYIGKEGVPFSQLQPHSSSSAITVDVPDNGELYVRRRLPNQTGAWVNIQARYNEKTFADIINQPYGIELNMNFMYIDNQGNEKAVYAQRFMIPVTQNANIFDSRLIISGIDKVLQVGGSIMADEDHEYMIPSSASTCTCNVVLDKQDNAVYVNSTSTSNRQDAYIDIWLIYTKA